MSKNHIEIGPTADRPSIGLWIGRQYIDTTVGLPIWYAGNGVWKTYAGATV